MLFPFRPLIIKAAVTCLLEEENIFMCSAIQISKITQK